MALFKLKELKLSKKFKEERKEEKGEMAEVVPLPICSTIQPNWHCNNCTPQFLFFFSSNPKSRRFPFPSHTLRLSLSNPYPSSSSPLLLLLPVCRATKSQSGGAPQVSKRLPSSEPSANSQKKKKTKRKKKKNSPTFADNLDDDDDVKIVRNVDGIDDHDYDGDDDYKDSNLNSNSSSLSHHQHPPSMPLPKPPAGFVVDDTGRVLMASTKRIAAIVDPSNNSPLECIIRRVFRSSRGDECMLLCPVDTPVQMLKSTNIDGWSAVSDEEVEGILPAAAYALAKIHMHLVHSGFCYTARGRFCYSEDDIFDFRTDDGEDIEGMPAEGVEITCFHLDGAHYMVYTPSDPLLFVAVKDKNGQLQIVDDDLLEDPAIISAIDEETEFNALVEEETALLESLMGER